MLGKSVPRSTRRRVRAAGQPGRGERAEAPSMNGVTRASWRAYAVAALRRGRGTPRTPACPGARPRGRSPGVAGEELATGSGPVYRPARAGTAVRHDRDARLGQLTPRLVEQRVVRVEVAHLNMALEDAGALLKGVTHVGGGGRLGEERRGVQAVRRPGREVRRPVVERAGHARLVRVKQGRERADPERAQRGHPRRFILPVDNRPRPADKRPGRVEVTPAPRRAAAPA